MANKIACLLLSHAGTTHQDLSLEWGSNAEKKRKQKEMDGNKDGWGGRGGCGGWNPWQFDKPHLVMTLGDCFHPLLSVCAPTCRCVRSLLFLSLLLSPASLSTPLATFSLPPPLPSLPACQTSGAVASERAVEGSVAAASIWSCNGVKKSGLTDRRQSHRASLKTHPLDKEIIERRRQLGGPSAFSDVFIFFSLLAPGYYVH